MTSTYKPEITMYYGPINSDHRLIPAPDISISVEFNYSNDTIIGYTYIVNLNGTATALDLRELEYGDNIPESPEYGLGAVADHIHKLRQILSQNGNILQIIDTQTDMAILKARGGILRSFSFDQSNNNWIHGAPYSASLEFHSIDFMSNTESCSTTFLDPLSFPSGNAGIVDINNFKIKSFQDSWNFSFDEASAFNKVKQLDNSQNININNSSYNIQYTINAVGKNFYVYDNEATNSSRLLPAWEQAKNFVQYRLYDQVSNLLNNVLKNTYNNTCLDGEAPNNIHIPGSGSGILENIGDSYYRVFNEEISCDFSESEGSFSATYSATVKSRIGNSNWSIPEATHTFTKSSNTTNTANASNTVININGTIQGLIEGGLIRINEPLQLPDRGAFLVYNNGSNTKYDNAKKLLDKIYDASAYSSGIGCSGKRDLSQPFKEVMGITVDVLNITTAPDPTRDPRPDPPHPTSFNITHDYNNGTITYSAEYQTNNSFGRKYNEISIQTTNPTKIFATFNIPNSYSCPIIQELGTYTAKTVSITIQGVDLCQSNNTESPDIDLSTIIQCGECGYDEYWPISLPPQGNYILTQKQYTSNPVDGSFTINLGYICNTAGCGI